MLYKYILESKYEMKISNMFLVLLHPDNQKFYEEEIIDTGENMKQYLLNFHSRNSNGSRKLSQGSTKLSPSSTKSSQGSKTTAIDYIIESSNLSNTLIDSSNDEGMMESNNKNKLSDDTNNSLLNQGSIKLSPTSRDSNGSRKLFQSSRDSNGSRKLSQGSTKLSQGSRKLSQGSTKLSQDSKKLSQGSKKLSQGSTKSSRGSRKSSRGSKTTSIDYIIESSNLTDTFIDTLIDKEKMKSNNKNKSSGDTNNSLSQSILSNHSDSTRYSSPNQESKKLSQDSKTKTVAIDYIIDLTKMDSSILSNHSDSTRYTSPNQGSKTKSTAIDYYIIDSSSNDEGKIKSNNKSKTSDDTNNSLSQLIQCEFPSSKSNQHTGYASDISDISIEYNHIAFIKKNLSILDFSKKDVLFFTEKIKEEFPSKKHLVSAIKRYFN